MSIITDETYRDPRWHYNFIHNVCGDFVKNTLDYFVDYLYPRFSSISSVVGTYDKGVNYLRQLESENRELDKPILPAIILNPVGEFDFAESASGGRQLWRSPNIAPGMLDRIFEPIYQDKNILITPGFSRIKGELELIVLLNSFYEYFDVRVLFLQIFSGIGTNRPITPVIFDSFIILPSEVYGYTYSNDVEGTTYTLDWSGTGVSSQIIKSTNQTEYVYPCKIRPQFRLSNMGDGSERYGGEDKLSEWRLTATIEYEVELPTFITMKTNYLAERMNLRVRYGSVFSTYDGYACEIPVNQEISTFEWDSGLEEDSYSEIDLPLASDKVGDRSIIFKTRYFHIITNEESQILSDATTNLDITIPEEVTDIELLIVNSKNEKLEYSSHYEIINSTTLRLLSDYIDLDEDDILELYIYEYIGPSPRFSATCSLVSKVYGKMSVL